MFVRRKVFVPLVPEMTGVIFESLIPELNSVVLK